MSKEVGSANITALIAEARKAEKAVYLAAPESVARDLARIIKGVADRVEALSAVPVEGDYEAGYEEGFHHGRSTPARVEGEVEWGGEIVTASFEDGQEREPYCGLEDCECPDHEGSPLPAGTYITVRLDEDHPVGLRRVTVREVAR